MNNQYESQYKYHHTVNKSNLKVPKKGFKSSSMNINPRKRRMRQEISKMKSNRMVDNDDYYEEDFNPEDFPKKSTISYRKVYGNGEIEDYEEGEDYNGENFLRKSKIQEQ